MDAVKPFGDVRIASLLIIGHDPRLQHSQAKAKVAFFFDYLAEPRPRTRSEARKYDLANKVWDYVNDLAGRNLLLKDLYVTNLCNEFLEHTPGSGTVLIPDAHAQRGVEQIASAVAAGRFKVIVPMAVQPFYHLCRLGFIDEDSDQVTQFIAGARPRASKAQLGIYVQSGRAPFLAVCGQRFHHRGVPVMPVVHVRQWPKSAGLRYAGPMDMARQNIRGILG
jgi:hypothetical protein